MKNIKKEQKIQVVSELQGKFTKAKATVLTEYQGLTVQQMEELRRFLRTSGVEYRVVKNTLAKKAAEGTDAAQIVGHFDGPIGVAWGFHDPVVPIKVLSEFARKQDGFKIRVGVLEGRALGPAELKWVALLPSREILLGKVLGGVRAPLYGLAGVLQGIQRKLVYALNAVKTVKASAA